MQGRRRARVLTVTGSAGAGRTLRASRMTCSILLLGCVCLVAGCGAEPTRGNSQQLENAKANKKPVDGFEDVKLGQTFNETMVGHGEEFTPLSVQSCQRNLPITGCLLSTRDDGAPFRMIGGIPYRLLIDLNPLDKVTDVTLKYSRDGKMITGDDCRAILERTLDWVIKDYGSVYDMYGNDARQVASKLKVENEGWALIGRTFDGVPSGGVLKRAPAKWDDRRHVSIFATFIIVSGEANCEVAVGFEEPQSVPRPDLFRASAAANWDAGANAEQGEVN